ncbi:hypothetical protein PVAP13_3NG172271 [Panicum virgatum]|uniref:Uncharacterized protein n=1 Tax=Panicum virgatum TaxID=38727 RepID=A0A8T0UEV1_PANVG|nr:hypothetical protein PVAP13_3NG172271 [Panicum virgatum]
MHRRPPATPCPPAGQARSPRVAACPARHAAPPAPHVCRGLDRRHTANTCHVINPRHQNEALPLVQKLCVDHPPLSQVKAAGPPPPLSLVSLTHSLSLSLRRPQRRPYGRQRRRRHRALHLCSQQGLLAPASPGGSTQQRRWKRRSPEWWPARFGPRTATRPWATGAPAGGGGPATGVGGGVGAATGGGPAPDGGQRGHSRTAAGGAARGRRRCGPERRPAGAPAGDGGTATGGGRRGRPRVAAVAWPRAVAPPLLVGRRGCPRAAAAARPRGAAPPHLAV